MTYCAHLGWGFVSHKTDILRKPQVHLNSKPEHIQKAVIMMCLVCFRDHHMLHKYIISAEAACEWSCKHIK